MKQLIRPLFSYAGSLYHRTRALPWVWERLLNREARRLWQEQAALLPPGGEAIVRTLRERGIATAHISDFFPPHVFAELAGFVRERWATPEVQARARTHTELMAAEERRTGGPKKVFLVNLWEGESSDADQGKPALDLAHPFTRFSLSQPILAIANAYLGMFSKFRAWRLEATIPTPGGVRARSSQRWHRDEEDRKLVKVFLYLNDVDEAAGPFMYLARSQEGGRWRNIFPLVPPRGTRAMSGDEDSKIPVKDMAVMTGPAGTIIFCDTSGLHKGGLATGKVRFMYTSVHTSSASPWPIRYAYPQRLSPDGLSSQARYAVENDPDQRPPRWYR
jgi:hypothetical protein